MLLEDADEDVDAFEVLSVVEEDEGGLPELLGVDGRPAQLSARHLGLPLVEGGELKVVFVEVLEELLEKGLDFLVDPMSVSVLDHQVQGVDDRQMFQADFVVFKVLQKVWKL